LGVGISEGGRIWRKNVEGEYGGNTMYSCMKWKMRPVETIPGMGERGDKGEWMTEGVNSTMIYYKNFCKCHNVPSGQQ
jgi:hypothetical protein